VQAVDRRRRRLGAARLGHGGVEVEAGDDLLDRVELAHRQAAEQIRHARAGAHADDRGDAGVARPLVEGEHRLGRLPVVVDVEIVNTGGDGGAQHRRAEAEEGTDGVEDDAGAGEQVRQCVGVAHVDGLAARSSAERRGACRRGAAVEVADHHLVDELERRRRPRRVPSHPPAPSTIAFIASGLPRGRRR
jgi:hypothetical protein